jgi:anthranilate phosphoribosyltransferase
MATDTFRQPLTASAMREVLTEIINGKRTPEQIREFLSALASRGETAEEIATAVEVMREHAVPLPLSRPYELTDTCGTGGDGAGTINVSTLAALTAAAAGVRIAKHGNRAASSRCGSADVLEALGLNLNASPTQVARSIEEIGFGFCFAPKFHPAMKAVAEVRRTLGIRTIFNLAGPLANPVGPQLKFQLVGVSDKRLVDPTVGVLLRLRIRHGLVVHGADGLDEVTTTGKTYVREVGRPFKEPPELSPEKYGLPRATLDQLRGGDVAANAALARRVLSGAPSPHRDIVALNAGCVLYTADQATTIEEGIAQAIDALESGRARTLLERAVEMCRA